MVPTIRNLNLVSDERRQEVGITPRESQNNSVQSQIQNYDTTENSISPGIVPISPNVIQSHQAGPAAGSATLNTTTPNFQNQNFQQTQQNSVTNNIDYTSTPSSVVHTSNSVTVTNGV